MPIVNLSFNLLIVGGVLRYASGGAIPLPSLTFSRKKRSAASYQDYITKMASKIVQYNPTTKSLIEATDKTEKQICLLDAQHNKMGANNSISQYERFQKIKKGFKLLRGSLDNFLEVMKVSSLDFSLESSNDSNRYPVFFSQLQELTSKMVYNFGQVQQNEFETSYFENLNELLKLISSETIKLRAGFILFPDATCQVGPTRLLQCLCTDDSDSYHRIDISPSFQDGKILAFKNFIFKDSDFKKDELKTCFYQADSDFFLLNEECCIALQKNSKNAVLVCPSTEVSNYSPVKISSGLMLIDDRFKTIETRCDASSTMIDKSSDIIRLSSCDAKITGQNDFVYKLKQNGNYNSDYILNNALETTNEMNVKDLILYLICVVMGLILIFLVAILICCFRKYSNGLNCFRQQNVQNRDPILPMGNFEMAEVQELRPVVTVQRVRNARAIK